MQRGNRDAKVIRLAVRSGLLVSDGLAVHDPRSKPFSQAGETVLKQSSVYATVTSLRGVTVMWAFIENIYREYRLARLQECGSTNYRTKRIARTRS